MTIFNFYIFNKRGAALYYREWNRQYNSFASDDQDEERKLMFGMIVSLKELLSKMQPPGAVDDGLRCLKTSTYTLHRKLSSGGTAVIVVSAISIHPNSPSSLSSTN
jgi:hypothetical protein